MRQLVLEISDWLTWASTWASIAMGLVVTLGVLWFSGVLLTRRRSVAKISYEDLPWEKLLELLKASPQDGDEALGDLNELPPDQLLQLLLKRLPKQIDPGQEQPTPNSAINEPEAVYLKFGQRRRSRRRWLNPIEVRFTTAFDFNPINGVVINRSDGGIAFLTDAEHAPGSLLFVTPVEAPKSLPSVGVTVRHAQKAGKLWIIGCEFLNELPWNVKVWFG